MLCLGNGPPRLLCNPAIKSTPSPQANKLHSKLGHTSLSLFSSWRSRPLGQFFRPVVIRAQYEPPTPSSNGRNHSHILKVLATLKSLAAITAALASDKVEHPVAKFKLPSGPSKEEVDAIKMQAVRLMKKGKAECAVDFLRSEYKEYMDDAEPAYYLEMALVEILICQGKYKQALECNCLKDDHRLPSDARFPLYKAIIYTMLDDEKEATKWWEDYLKFVEEGFDPLSKTFESSD